MRRKSKLPSFAESCLFISLHSGQAFHLHSSAKSSYFNGSHQQAKEGRNLKVCEKCMLKICLRQYEKLLTYIQIGENSFSALFT